MVESEMAHIITAGSWCQEKRTKPSYLIPMQAFVHTLTAPGPYDTSLSDLLGESSVTTSTLVRRQLTVLIEPFWEPNQQTVRWWDCVTRRSVGLLSGLWGPNLGKRKRVPVGSTAHYAKVSHQQRQWDIELPTSRSVPNHRAVTGHAEGLNGHVSRTYHSSAFDALLHNTPSGGASSTAGK
jgi:hypothetical protein